MRIWRHAGNKECTCHGQALLIKVGKCGPIRASQSPGGYNVHPAGNSHHSGNKNDPPLSLPRESEREKDTWVPNQIHSLVEQSKPSQR